MSACPTCLLAAGWHYLPKFKDVAAAVPLPNFISAGEVKIISAQLPFSCHFCSTTLHMRCLSIFSALSTMLHRS